MRLPIGLSVAAAVSVCAGPARAQELVAVRAGCLVDVDLARMPREQLVGGAAAQ